ncbi:MAG: NAD(P)-dependent oxidoreductase [Bacteroidales bacterium]|jgi:nucleoside-diphosphate-sugar epimerase|nr:NAD(P)-dependent oxidoreductase [Bacteroidales bacterium]
MNILITGATGFIGQHLLKSLSQEHEIHVLIRPSTKWGKDCILKKFIFNDNIEELKEYIVRNQIEGIIHLASLFIAQHQSYQCKDLILSNVFLGTALLEAAKETSVQWFLNTGTYWQNYLHDSTKYDPVNLYAATKQAFIDISKYYTETSDIKFVTLKICDTYGPKDPRRKLMSLFKQYAESGEQLKMSPGEQKINLLYIDDVVNGFITLVNLLCNKTQLKNEYALSAKKTYSLQELAGIFETVSKKKLNILWGGLPYREREVMTPWQPSNIVPSWKPKIDIYQGIKLFLS